SGRTDQAIPIDVDLSADGLSATMTLVVTGVGFVIHLYSVGYMGDDPGYHRYFAYLNLFIFSMLVLVLGDNLAVLFVGWEGVGLCSYLLIGFWFHDEAKAAAGKKAFITNRVGDLGLLVAMAMLLYHAGTLKFSGLQAATDSLLTPFQIWPIGLKPQHLPSWYVSAVSWLLTPEWLAWLKGFLLLQPHRILVATVIGLALFLGCAGKSAQIPLYVWLPDAMAGPTPVSALIHAATMVTAGVYLVARLHFVFALSPAAMAVVVVVGVATALFAASIALAQNDLKKVLAYSTVSQLGFMFVGVGAGAFDAGFFHVFTHAFFKACLFLCAGSVIYAMHKRIHDDDRAQDMRQMGGFRHFQPITHWTYLISCLAIAGCPGLAGFWSKDEILFKTYWNRIKPAKEALKDFVWTPPGWFGPLIFWLGILAAVGTAFYMFRSYFMTFHGEFRGWKVVKRWKAAAGQGHEHHEAGERLAGPMPAESPWVMTLPLVLLAVGALFAGFLYAHPIHTAPLSHVLEPVFTRTRAPAPEGLGLVQGPPPEGNLLGLLMLAGIGAFAVGLAGAGYVYYLRGGAPARAVAEAVPRLYRLVRDKWRIDELYQRTVIGLLDALGDTAAQFDKWVVDGVLAKVTAAATQLLGTLLRAIQTGRVQVYAAGMVVGTVAVGWFLLQPHAAAAVDESALRESGRALIEASPGIGYAYRWTEIRADAGADAAPTTDAGVPFAPGRRQYVVQVEPGESKTVQLEVRNAFEQVTRASLTVTRPQRPGASGSDAAGAGEQPPGLPFQIPRVPGAPPAGGAR
ncbi:MAG: NADH-quinone oxidoreductase subunit L, partial [Deltaproteobacteria bacterium]|nr:NADH-quinone oxidoreductase subunit L [Deltaproteobacteria bacterium]